MSLSAPIYLLKQQAKALSRQENIPLHQALDQIAHREGFRAWSLLSSQVSAAKPVQILLSQLHPGELVLLGSRPGQGKTLLSLDLAVQTMRCGGHAAFFTLDFTPAQLDACFQTLGADRSAFGERFVFDDSDKICAGYLIETLGTPAPGMLVVVDYLQLLDQRRENPELMVQVRQLRTFARERQVIVVCLSQIDRRFDAAPGELPSGADIRLPNPLDLALFDKLCFLHQGKLRCITSAVLGD